MTKRQPTVRGPPSRHETISLLPPDSRVGGLSSFYPPTGPSSVEKRLPGLLSFYRKDFTMTTNTYALGFASSQVIPTDLLAIVELTVAEAMSYIDLHDRFVDLLTAWTHNDQDAHELCLQIDGPVTVGAILMALDSLNATSLEHWLSQAGLTGFRVMTSEAVFDFDAALDK